MLDLIQEFEAIIPIPDDAKIRLIRNLKEEQFNKKDYLLKSGEICRKLYFVHRGMIYGYFKYRGRNITMRFAKSRDICFVPESFFQQTPSKESLVTVYPSVVYSISYEAVQDLQRSIPQFYKIIDHYFLKDYMEANSCLYMLRAMDGFHRYKWLRENRPDLLIDLPIRKTCSYIEMSTASLGRFIKRDTGRSKQAAKRVAD